MTTRRQVSLVHVGEYVAEVDIDLIITDDEWSPYLSVDDAYKLDDVRQALAAHDLETAARHARVFRLVPVSAP